MARTRIAVIASFVLLAVGMSATQHRPARADARTERRQAVEVTHPFTLAPK